MDALPATFEEELTARERANPQSTRQAQERVHHTASSLFSGSRESKADPQCTYCQQSHSFSSCSSVTGVAARKQILKSSGRCYNCLRRNHVSHECKCYSQCQKCRKKHHTSICDTSSNPPRHTSNHDASSSEPHRASNQDVSSSQPQSLVHSTGSGLNPGATSYQSNTTANNLCSDNLRAVLLQTACAVIHNPDDSHISLKVRLLLDSGSQKSYIIERARELLHLDKIGEQSLSIATFGSHRGSRKVCSIVNVGLSLRAIPQCLSPLCVMPTICEPLVGQPIAACIEQHPHLLGLELADFSNSESSLPIDVLIGSDYY